jgi:hypothetical protein
MSKKIEICTQQDTLLQEMFSYESDVILYVERVLEAENQSRQISLLFKNPDDPMIQKFIEDNRLTKIDEEFHKWTRQGLQLLTRRIKIGMSIDALLR